MRDLMISGVVISGGMSVVIFIFGAVCASAVDALNAPTNAAISILLVFIVAFFPMVDCLIISLRLVQLWSSPLAVEGCFFRPVEAHIHRKRTLRRGQPVGFLVLARGFALNQQRQSAVSVTMELR